MANKGLVSNGELARALRISTGYVNNLCRRLEKWGVLRPYRDPVSGRILWSIAGTRVSQLVLKGAEEEGVRENSKSY